MADNNSNRWMPTAGGIISIVSGILGIIGSLVLGCIAIVFQTVPYDEIFYHIEDPDMLPVVTTILWVSCVITLVVSIIPIIGGIFAIRRKRWGWALAGAICATIASNILGIIALVFIAMSKKEFTGQTGAQNPQLN